MPALDDETLLPILRSYVAAADELLHFHDRDREGGTIAGRKIEARHALYEHLIACGWIPPSDVAATLETDRILPNLDEGASSKL